MTRNPETTQALTAEGLLALIERHLPELWRAHACSGNRSLRAVLRSAEALLATQAGKDVAPISQTQRGWRREGQ